MNTTFSVPIDSAQVPLPTLSSLADLAEIERLWRPSTRHLRTRGGNNIGRAGVARVGGRATGKRSAVIERAADLENDAKGHARCQDGCHGGDSGFDTVILSRWLDNKPEQHVYRVDEPDRAV